jgi:SAM-dependent methyltransferase
MSAQPWFRHWFGEAYQILYPHRDALQAQRQVRFLLQATLAQPEWKILDIGCGHGRHLQAFLKQGFTRTIGIDLSAAQLADARKQNLAVARADMRMLPFPPGHFDLVASLFTSFGYFATSGEDLDALAGFGACLRPQGFLFLDLPNKNHILENLVAADERHVDGMLIVQKRRVERHADGDQVVKSIEMRAANGQTQAFEERVRLWELAPLQEAALRLGLRLQRVFGDECGSEYAPDASQRMALLLRRKP